MKVLQINIAYNQGSTGKIAYNIHNVCNEEQIICKTAYAYQKSKNKYTDTICISSWWDNHVHNRLARYTLLHGCFSWLRTWCFMKKVDKFAPDIIQLHNIHGNYINIYQLFRYIKKKDIKVVWTLHDCWGMTGYCPYFTMSNCRKWMSECTNCGVLSNIYNFPVDRTKHMYRFKKKLFTGVNDMTIVTPSQWLADIVKKSFLQEYPVKVINNGIDLGVFRPRASNFRARYNLKNQYIVLGVADNWEERKGLDVFEELAKRLDKRFQLVLVGTTEEIEKKITKDIITIRRTQNQDELAEIYAEADVFANPTREDNYPTVNMESLACGTPVVTFRTGGSPEMISSTCGCVVECDDIESFCEKIGWVCTEKPFSQEACIAHASQFEQKDKFMQYVDLYKQIYNGDNQHENCTYCT